jgi:hypothetical protein
MRTHIDVLGWLHNIWGAFGLLTGVALVILAAGTSGALAGLESDSPAGTAAIWMFLVCGALLIVGGAAMAVAGSALLRRRAAARRAVLVLAAPNLVLLPFGTALGIYAIWVLLNDDARVEFGRPARRTPLRRLDV